MKNKFFVGVVILFLVTFFAFFFRLFRPFVGAVISPVSQTVAAAVQESAVLGGAELSQIVGVNVVEKI